MPVLLENGSATTRIDPSRFGMKKSIEMIAREFLKRPNKYTPNPIVTISITPPGIPIQDFLDSIDGVTTERE